MSLQTLPSWSKMVLQKKYGKYSLSILLKIIFPQKQMPLLHMKVWTAVIPAAFPF